MAIFGLFGKKDKPTPAERKSSSEGQAGTPAAPHAAPPARKPRPRDLAAGNATAKKIDAIESEMSEEFSTSRPMVNTAFPTPAGQRKPASPATRPAFESTLPSMGMSTEFLLGPQGKSTDIIISSEAAQVVEEAAILYASDQASMAEQVLLIAIEQERGRDAPLRPWLMLLDLYLLSGRQADFDALSIRYASQFETSPPSWRDTLLEALLPEKNQAPAPAAMPAVAFVGRLDGNIIRLLERVQKLGESSRSLRLDFTRVTEVDPVGCGLLLKILKRLQASEHELVLVSARELAEKIRAILKVGRRDETEAPWLLLLELLRLLHAESEFEDASMDYCVTFEVSPPAYEAPRSKVTMDEAGTAAGNAQTFPLPAEVAGNTDALVAAAAAFATTHDPAVFDCSALRRMDFNAAGQLLSSLEPVAASGRVIEFIEVNQMVAALMDVIGLKDFARISARKA